VFVLLNLKKKTQGLTILTESMRASKQGFRADFFGLLWCHNKLEERQYVIVFEGLTFF